MNKKLFRVITLVFLVFALVTIGCTKKDKKESKTKTYNFKLGHVRPAGSTVDKDLAVFTQEIAEKTGDRITFTVYPASQLGDYTVVQERVSIGDIEMNIGPPANTIDKRLAIASMPYIVVNWDQAKTVYEPGSLMREYLKERLEEQGLHVLAFYPVYFGGVMTLVPVDDPSKVKIRVPPSKSFELTATSIGFIATPIPWADTFTSLQTKIVDGAIGGGAEGYYSNFKDLIKYYYPYFDHLENWLLYINKDLWEELSDEDQAIIEAAATKFENERWKNAPGEEQKYEQKLSDLGVEIVPIPEDELQSIQQKAREVVWPAMKDNIDLDVLNEIYSTVK